MSEDNPSFVEPTAVEQVSPAPKPGQKPVHVDDSSQVEAAVAAALAEAEERFEKEASKLRAEAGRHRMEKKEAIANAVNAARQEVQDELSDFQVQAQSNLNSVQKFEALIAAGVPVEIMPKAFALVSGHDPDSIAESVAAVIEVMSHTVRDQAIDPLQGHGSQMPLNGDPILESLKKMVGY